MQTHHAVLYCASHYSLVPVLSKVDQRSPDVRIVEESPLSIGSVRTLIDEAYRRPLRDEVQLFIISTAAIAPEAQQALLKILEEPPATTRFALVLPHEKGLLPTVLSRLSIDRSAVGGNKEQNEFNEFLLLSYGERMQEIAARVKAKDQAWTEAIFDGCTELARRHDDVLLKKVTVFALSEKDRRGASRKMLLEHLALLLPAEKA